MGPPWASSNGAGSADSADSADSVDRVDRVDGVDRVVTACSDATVLGSVCSGAHRRAAGRCFGVRLQHSERRASSVEPTTTPFAAPAVVSLSARMRATHADQPDPPDQPAAEGYTAGQGRSPVAPATLRRAKRAARAPTLSHPCDIPHFSPLELASGA